MTITLYPKKLTLEDDLETGAGAKAAAVPTRRSEMADENFIVLSVDEFA